MSFSTNPTAISLFLTGIWFPKIGIPFILLVLLCNIKKNVLRVNNFSFFAFIVIILFIITYVLLWNDPSIPETASYFKNKKLFMLFQLIVIITCVFWIVRFINKKENLFYLLYLFVLGMLIKSAFYVLYTFLYAPEMLGIRQLIDPFSLQPINTPSISLMAVFGTLFSFYNLFQKDKRKLFKLINTILFSLGLFIAILLQARTFFVIVFIFLMYFFILKFSMKKILKLVPKGFMIILIIILINDILIENSTIYAQVFEITINRFQDLGVESKRYEHWSSAFEIILNNPTGGGATNKAIEHTYWFHNFWLDVGRTSGFIPLVLILLFQSLIFIKLKKHISFNSSTDFHFLTILYISLLIGFSVEIPLEGNIVMFVFFIFFSSLLLQFIQLDKTKEHQK